MRKIEITVRIMCEDNRIQSFSSESKPLNSRTTVLSVHMDKMANANKKNGDRWNFCIVYEKQNNILV